MAWLLKSMKLAYDSAHFDQKSQELPPIVLKKHKVTKLFNTETSLGMLKGAKGDERSVVVDLKRMSCKVDTTIVYRLCKKLSLNEREVHFARFSSPLKNTVAGRC